jgi:hypothetical protein
MSSVIKNFVENSFNLNMILCGFENDVNDTKTFWSKNKKKNKELVEKFLSETKKIAEKVKESFTVYRGTDLPSPTMQPFTDQMSNCQYMSTSKSKSLAKEFSRKKGFLHHLRLEKGVKYLDIQKILKSDENLDKKILAVIKREKEIVLLPGCNLKLISFNKNIVKWLVSKENNIKKNKIPK